MLINFAFLLITLLAHNVRASYYLDRLTGAIMSHVNCDFSGEPTFEHVGQFNKSAEYTTGGSCFRSLIYCAPEDPKGLVDMFLSKPSGAMNVNITWHEPADCSKFEGCEHVVYMTHGFLESRAVSSWLDTLSKAWTVRGSCGVVLEWSRGNYFHYFQATSNVRTVGAALGHHLVQCQPDPKKVTLVGFSLGGQIVGEASKYYFNKTGTKISRCTGLDPAGPLFAGCDDSVKLTPDDCELVQVVHSDAEQFSFVPALSGFGTPEKSGKCDYWVNCGFSQNCSVDVLSMLTGGQITMGWLGKYTGYGSESDAPGCDHKRSVQVYLSQVMNKCIYGNPCDDCGKVTENTCIFDQEVKVPMVIDNDCLVAANYRVDVSGATEGFCMAGTLLKEYNPVGGSAKEVKGKQDATEPSDKEVTTAKSSWMSG